MNPLILTYLYAKLFINVFSIRCLHFLQLLTTTKITIIKLLTAGNFPQKCKSGHHENKYDVVLVLTERAHNQLSEKLIDHAQCHLLASESNTLTRQF